MPKFQHSALQGLGILLVFLSLLGSGCFGLETPGVKDPGRTIASFVHTGTEPTCLQCHAPVGDHAGKNDCKLCHLPRGSWGALTQYSHAQASQSCGTCHEIKRPAQAAFPAPSAAKTGHFPDVDCSSCHAAPVGDSPSRAFLFSHADSAARAVTSCLPCHEEGRKNPSHYAGQDCVSCHADPGKSWGASSVTPHPQNTPALLSCNQCHESQRPATTQFPAPGTSAPGHYSTRDCYGCHNPKSNSIATFAFDHRANGNPMLSCMPCHEAKRKSPDHFPAQDCSGCHQDPGKSWAQSALSPHPENNPAPISCNACHETARPGTTQYPAPGPAVSGHFPLDDCLNCHLPRTASVTKFLFQHNANGTTTSSCIPCHEAKRPAAITSRFLHNNYGAGDCYSCHDKSASVWSGGTYGHNPEPSVCANCHTSDRPAALVGRFLHSPYGTGECNTCHTRTGVAWSGGIYSHQPAPATCVSCHAADRPASTVNGFSHTQSGTGECASCHTYPGVKWTSGTYSHSPTPASCNSCHSSTRPTTTSNRFSHTQYGTGDCVSCHTQNVGTNWTGGNYNHAPAPASCNLCHSGDRPAAVVNGFSHATYGTGDCVSCHTNLGTTWAGGMFSHAPTPSACNSCHETQRPSTHAYPNMAAGTGHYTAKDCYACHRPKMTGITTFVYGHSNAVNTNIRFCLPCHLSQGQTKHSGSSSVSFAGDGNCYNCHTKKRSWDN